MNFFEFWTESIIPQEIPFKNEWMQCWCYYLAANMTMLKLNKYEIPSTEITSNPSNSEKTASVRKWILKICTIIFQTANAWHLLNIKIFHNNKCQWLVDGSVKPLKWGDTRTMYAAAQYIREWAAQQLKWAWFGSISEPSNSQW